MCIRDRHGGGGGAVRPARDHGPRQDPGDRDGGPAGRPAVHGADRPVRATPRDRRCHAAGVTRVAHEDDEATLLYTRDVAGTIGALLGAAEALGVEPRGLGIRSPSLEAVFLALTGHAIRD